MSAEPIRGSLRGRKYKLIRKQNPNGDLSPFYYVDFEWQRRRVKQSTGTTHLPAAHQVAKAKLAAAMAGHWQQLDDSRLKQDTAMIGEVLTAYREGIPARTRIAARTVKGNVSALAVIMRTVLGPEVGMERLRTNVLTRELLQRFKDLRYPASGSCGEQETAATTINSTLAQARSIFSKQALELYRDRGLKLPDLAGFLAVARLKDDRDVSFRPIPATTLAEIDRAAAAMLLPDPARVIVRADGRIDRRMTRARPDVFLAYLMARYLGMRDVEMVAARWEWLECWEHGTMMAIVKRAYFRPKYSEGRVPIGPELAALLREHGDGESLWILPASSPTARHDAVYRDANLWLRQWLPDREKCMHELRKQAGSEVYTRDKSLSSAAAFLRNKEETCRKHYATLLVPIRPLAMPLRVSA